MELTVFNITGEDTGKKVELNDNVFGIQPNDHAIYLDVKRVQAANRQGTAKARERSEIAASTKKIKRQKGTGTARAGSRRNPLFRGGGRIFGPRPQDHSFKLNKKVKALARKSALSYKAKNDSIKIIEDFNLEVPKTKEIVNMLSSLKLNNDKKPLFVLVENNKNIFLSSRNIPGIEVITVNELNTFNIMNASSILFVESSVEHVNNIFNN